MDDGLGGEEAEGANECGAHNLPEGFVLALEFGLVVGIVGFFAEFLGALFEDDWGVGFLEEEEAGYLDQSVGDGGRVEYPSPGCVFGDEAACDGSDGWAEERCQTVDSDAFAALFGLEAVREDATTDLGC